MPSITSLRSAEKGTIPLAQAGRPRGGKVRASASLPPRGWGSEAVGSRPRVRPDPTQRDCLLRAAEWIEKQSPAQHPPVTSPLPSTFSVTWEAVSCHPALGVSWVVVCAVVLLTDRRKPAAAPTGRAEGARLAMAAICHTLNRHRALPNTLQLRSHFVLAVTPRG